MCWSQDICEGDLDYVRLVEIIREKGISPLLVNEQIPDDLPSAFSKMKSYYKKSLAQMGLWFDS